WNTLSTTQESPLSAITPTTPRTIRASRRSARSRVPTSRHPKPRATRPPTIVAT
ncbi:MAG: hypothetical protein AVDCRST_MAG69-1379, partial [uncultured Solirubrobacteraceae bacterium]